MSKIKYTVECFRDGASVIYQGTANTPEEALSDVYTLTNCTAMPVPFDENDIIRPKKLLKVGDKVVATESNSEVPPGTRGVIEEVDDGSDYLPYLVRYENGEDFWAESSEVTLDTSTPSRPVIKVGDKVRIVRKVEAQEGWHNRWVSEMDDYVNDGVVYTVSGVNSLGIYLEGNDWGWPPAALEVVNLEPRVGARIRIVDADDGRYSNGHVGTIVDITSFGGVHVLFDAGQEGVFSPETTKYVSREEYEVIG